MSDEDDFEGDFVLRNVNLCIVGLGLMGGSVGMGLHQKCKAMIGIDSSQQARDKARLTGVFDQVFSGIEEVPENTNAFILAAPISGSIICLNDLSQKFTGNAVVMDLCSTKAALVNAMDLLPERFDPIGGHPICGKEKLGIENADPGIFKDSIFIISPLERSGYKAEALAQSVADALQSVCLIVPADEHDAALARTSHLPFLIASALAQATERIYSPFVGSGFTSTARIAATPTSMMLDVMKTNREEILSSAEDYLTAFTRIIELLADENYSELKEQLDNNQQRMNDFTNDLNERKSNP
ncbi:MAG: prephenate dehydrogenase [Anaerolineales bacterium]|nr:prephenate dehydrogenase [Anaerolineales bacterium]